MSDEEETGPCSICHEQHEQMLMLSCIHDPCINCAAAHFCQNEISTGIADSYYCSVCGKVTELDPSSIHELRKLYAKNMKKEKKKYDQHRDIKERDQSKEKYSAAREIRERETPVIRDFGSSERFTYHNYSQPQTVQPSSTAYQYSGSNLNNNEINYQEKIRMNTNTNYIPQNSRNLYNGSKPPIHSVEYKCRQHIEELLSYFCFTCSTPICPECVIHGPHKDHEVQTNKKSIEIVREKIAGSMDGLKRELGDLQQLRDFGRKLLKDTADQAKSEHEFMRGLFISLKGLIAEKEKEIMKSIDVVYDRNTAAIKSFSNEVDSKIDKIVKLQKNIDISLRKDDVSVLSDFGKNEDEVGKTIEQIRQGSNVTDLQNNQSRVDRTEMQKEIDQILTFLAGMELNVHEN